MKFNIPFTQKYIGFEGTYVTLGTQASDGPSYRPQNQNRSFNGNKFTDSFGPSISFVEDYWTLRTRSQQLFTENLYARGLIRRYITNIINTGLAPEVDPETNILGLPDGSLDDWSENVENRFEIWADDPQLCDFKGQTTFWKLQRQAKQAALISGDILRVFRYVKGQQLPLIQLIDGSLIQTPLLTEVKLKNGNKIDNGVEMDSRKRHIAYWIVQDDGTTKRLPVTESRTGRPIAKLIYGIDNKLDAVRGTPLLAIILQSLKELDRYRDSAQRSATIQSLLAMFIEKTQDKIASNPITRSAVRTDEQLPELGAKEYNRSLQIADANPGIVVEELQHGEKIVMGEPKGAVNFKEFEEVLVQAMAWAMEVPPEILRLSFSSNYAASTQANAEFLMFLNKERKDFGKEFCQDCFQEWFTTEVSIRKITASSYLSSLRNPNQYDIKGAWLNNSWSGAIKPAGDIVKTGKGYKMYVDEGYITRSRATRETTGQKFSRNVKRLLRENTQLAEANRPLLELEAEIQSANAPKPGANTQAMHETLIEAIEDIQNVSS